MRWFAYSVFDAGANCYSAPFFCRARGEALRSFAELAGDGKSAVSKYPVHFSLWFVGEYDDVTGSLLPCAPQIVILAKDVVNSFDPSSELGLSEQ